MELLGLVPAAGILAILFALYLARDVLSRDKGTKEMQEVAAAIYEGAMAFLNRQYRAIALYAVLASIGIGILLAVLEKDNVLGVQTSVAFLLGAACSAISGFIGMFISVQANLRTAAAAQHSLKEALNVSLRGGAVSGFLVVALSLLGVFLIFIAYGGLQNPAQAPFHIVGFGFGASFVALFAQLGGGIYTKAADVGSDLVGKVEAGIPEDDPRNAAVIADLVGDNVGDCAGRGADLFESTAAENIGAIILGIAVYLATPDPVTGALNPAWILFPLVVRAVGIVASMVGVLVVGLGDVTDPMASLNRGQWVMNILAALGIAAVTMTMLQNVWFVYAGLTGLATSIAFVYITQYYTAGSYRPVQEIARASRTGPATNIISGVAIGFESTAITAIVISIAIAVAYFFGVQSGVPHGGLYGTAAATMGMLTTVAYILAMDTFGPITDNAGGIAEMSRSPEGVRRLTDELDAVGNTTKALTKGYAVGSAALAAFLLFSAYIDKVKDVLWNRCVDPSTRQACLEQALGGRSLSGVDLSSAINIPFPVDLAKPEVFIGGLLGIMLVFFFSSLAIRAVGRAAGDIIEEVRRQFKEKPGIMDYTEKPDYARCVDITARSALREMVLPGFVALAVPIAVGLIFKAEAMASFLMVGTMGGILLATVLNNAGGTWDNAKKFIESGQLAVDGIVMGKGSEPHKAAVVGDTVGDPFKDTAGPSLHVLIKLLSTITLVLAPLFIA